MATEISERMYSIKEQRQIPDIHPRAICLISCPLIFVQLRAFKHSFIVNSPIDKVWEFYTDVKHLELITPKEMRLKIINSTSEMLIQGSEIWLEAKLIICKMFTRCSHTTSNSTGSLLR
jgi:hypothetical protein